MPFSLPPLPFAPAALAPHMSSETLGLHHGKHHQTYVDKLNGLIADTPMASWSLEKIIKESFEDPKRAGIFNNASQHWNHVLFWESITPGGGEIPSSLESALTSSFGSLEKFRDAFVQAGIGQFGSGWCWLVQTSQGELQVTKTPNGVNPVCFGQKALLGCDVWEHAYYLDYQNRRPDYLQSFLQHLVNWKVVAQNLAG